MKLLSLLGLYLFVCASLLAQNPQHELTIVFTGPEETVGEVLFRVQNEKAETVKEMSIAFKKRKQEVSLVLPSGRYAIAAFHDQNGNGKIDKNWVGVPTEPYGFSNNARGTVSEPDLADQLFSLNKDRSLEIVLR